MTNKQFLYREHKLTHYAWTRLRECERHLHAWAEDQCNCGESWIDEEHWLSLARGTAARFNLKILPPGRPAWLCVVRLQRQGYGGLPLSDPTGLQHPSHCNLLTMIAPLSQDQKDLILYCLEQQYYEFNEAEQRDYEFIITKLGLKKSE